MDVFVTPSASSVIWTQIPVLLALGALCVLQWRSPAGLVRLGRGLDGPAGLCLLAGLLSLIFGPWQWLGVQTALPWLGGLALAYALAQMLRGAPPARLHTAARLTALAGVLACAWAVWTKTPAIPVALVMAGWCAALSLAEDSRLRRMGWMLGVCFAFFVATTGAGTGAIVATVCVLCGYFWLLRARGLIARKHLALALFLCGVLTVMFLSQPRGASRSALHNGFNLSLAHWVGDDHIAALRAGWLLGNERPLTGWGPGSGVWMYPRVAAQTRAAPQALPDLGNTPAQLYAETGALGLLGFFGLLFGVFRRLRRLPDEAATPGYYACAAGGGLSLLLLGVFALFACPQSNPLLPWFAGISLGLMAAALPRASFPPKTRWACLVLTAAILLFAGVHTVRYAGACRALERGDFSKAMAAYPDQFAFAAAQAEKTVPPVERAALLAVSLKANPYQPALWRQMAALAYQAGRWDEARACAQTAYRLAPNMPGILPLLAAIEGARGHAERIPVLLALESLNDPSFLLESTVWESPQLRTQAYALLDGLLPSMEGDMPAYAGALKFAQSFLEWSRTGAPILPLAHPEAAAHPFWKAIAVLRQGGTPPLPEDEGWACLLRLWNAPAQSRGKILDAWYGAHPALAYTPQKRAALLARMEETPRLPGFLEPLEDNQPNPLWDDLDLRGVFPQRGALPPAVRLPLYEALANPPQAN